MKYIVDAVKNFYSKIKILSDKLKTNRYCNKFKVSLGKLEMKDLTFTFLFSVVNIFIYNSYAIGEFYAKTGSLFNTFLILLALLFLNLSVFSIIFNRWTTKTLSIIFIICNVAALYFMKTYNVLIDNVMLLNVLQTDRKEVLELINLKLIIFNIFFGILPCYLIYKVKIKYNKNFIRSTLNNICAIIIYSLLTISFLLFNYKNISSTVRENRSLRYAIVPVNYISSVLKILNETASAKKQREFLKISGGVQFQRKVKNGKKNLIVFIVGEAARVANFSLNGYDFKTNEPLEKQNLIFFKNVFSCGTSTAISIPCLFSHKGRRDFKVIEASSYENLLNFLSKNNSNILWIENNSGCKGICKGFETLNYADGGESKFCDNKRKECFDEALIENLDSHIRAKMKAENNFIFLHQKGSHGPAYFLRVPDNFKKFKPYCKSEYFNNCTREEIVSSYNNTIYYTSYIINQTIEELKKQEKYYNVALFYISDHGQSLGENNIYLHGMPYSIAPETQKHIPFLLWFSKDFEKEFGINRKCLNSKVNKELSHDNIFHSLLGLFKPETEYYKKELDIFYDCQMAGKKD